MYDTSRYNSNSRFWLNDDEFSKIKRYYDLGDSLNLGDVVEKTKILKTISNFVNIVTNSNIPVIFQGQQAKSDGKMVTVSADVKDFDMVCGLSLHEASHVKYSQPLFDILETINKDAEALSLGSTPSNPYVVKANAYLVKYNRPHVVMANIMRVIKYLHELTNIIEDYRIDSLTISEYPGYKGYYDALIAEYLITPQITNKLRNDPKLNEESYFAYKMNLSAYLGNHPQNNLLKLKGGSEIVKILDVDFTKISAIDAMNIVFDIFDVIEKNVLENKEDEKEDQSKGDEKADSKSKSQKDGERGDSGKSDGETETSEDENEDEDGNGSSNSNSDEDEDENENGSGNGSSDKNEDEDESENGSGNGSSDEDEEDGDDESNNGSDSDLDNGFDDDDDDNTDNNKSDEDIEEKSMDEFDRDDIESKTNSPAIKKLVNAINGQYNKKSLSGAEIQIMDLVSNNKFKVKSTTIKAGGKSRKVDVTVINKLDESILDYTSDIFSSHVGYVTTKNMLKTAINKGRALGSKLVLMNDTHLTKSIRRRTGNIDDRLLAEVGHGNVKIFNRTSKNQYEKQFVHISIDSSGSMMGSPFANSLKMAATIASAATFINGMRVQVSVRSTADIRFGKKSGQVPYVAIIYDSKFDTLEHIKSWWPRLYTPGVTPEGICFEAIKDIILESSKDKNSFFINLSDGSPAFSTPGWDYEYVAEEHQKIVNKMFKTAGIHIMGYLIGDKRDSSAGRFFENTYGKDAQFIDTQNINDIARTLNRKFLGV